jgi:peptide-methionine (S)-S-oxide reductase
MAAFGNQQIAMFAGGCFWCVESDFNHVPGVSRTISEYTGGNLKDPTYKEVSAEEPDTARPSKFISTRRK